MFRLECQGILKYVLWRTSNIWGKMSQIVYIAVIFENNRFYIKSIPWILSWRVLKWQGQWEESSQAAVLKVDFDCLNHACSWFCYVHICSFEPWFFFYSLILSTLSWSLHCIKYTQEYENVKFSLVCSFVFSFPHLHLSFTLSCSF